MLGGWHTHWASLPAPPSLEEGCRKPLLEVSHTHTIAFRHLPTSRKDVVHPCLGVWHTHTHSTTAFARSLNRDEAPCLKLSTGACSVPCPPSGSLRPLHAWNAQLTHCQMEPPGCFAPLDLHKTALLFRQVSPGQPLHLAYTENTYWTGHWKRAKKKTPPEGPRLGLMIPLD